MKAFWTLQARRINALSLRERAIMFVSLAVAMAALADALVLSPRLAEQKALSAQLRQQLAELDGLRSQLAGSSAVAGADSPQGRLQATRSERAAVEAEITQRSTGGAATGLPELLERVLKRHERLTLLRLATASPQAGRDLLVSPQAGRDLLVSPQAGRDLLVSPQAGRDPAPATLPQVGVDLSLSGSFPDLATYLAEIESALPGVRWGDLHISSALQPPVLKVRVYLLGDMGAAR